MNALATPWAKKLTNPCNKKALRDICCRRCPGTSTELLTAMNRENEYEPDQETDSRRRGVARLGIWRGPPSITSAGVRRGGYRTVRPLEPLEAKRPDTAWRPPGNSRRNPEGSDEYGLRC